MKIHATAFTALAFRAFNCLSGLAHRIGICRKGVDKRPTAFLRWRTPCPSQGHLRISLLGGNQ